jgi:putative colanic acid biosynthesis acetyltransferase WcaF
MFFWRSWLLRCFGAKIGRDCFFYPKATIWAPWLLEAADVVTVADGVEVYNPGGVVLDHHSIVSQGAFLCGASHDFNDVGFPMIWKKITLEPYAWVCARAVVMPGVTVGVGAVLGAAAVTSKNLESMGVYVGNPARRVSTRTAELGKS